MDAGVSKMADSDPLQAFAGQEPWFRLEVKIPKFKYLWIKYVWGFDVREHCAKGLLGKYSQFLPFQVKRQPFEITGLLDEIHVPHKYIYLCGNTGVWERNVHVAMEYAPAEVLEFQHDYMSFHAVGLRQLPIHPVTNLPLEANYSQKYVTCRNWQFGFEYMDGAGQVDFLVKRRRELEHQGRLF